MGPRLRLSATRATTAWRSATRSWRSIAIPAGQQPPYVLDMATTTVAAGKISNAIRDGRSIPLTYALGLDSRPTSDPVEAMQAIRMLPLGATKEGSGHKGYG